MIKFILLYVKWFKETSTTWQNGEMKQKKSKITKAEIYLKITFSLVLSSKTMKNNQRVIVEKIIRWIDIHISCQLLDAFSWSYLLQRWSHVERKQVVSLFHTHWEVACRHWRVLTDRWIHQILRCIRSLVLIATQHTTKIRSNGVYIFHIIRATNRQERPRIITRSC